MDKECERRLRIMGTSSVVGGDIRAALAEVDRLRAERDRRNKVDPITRLHNLCDGLADQRGGSPYTADAWAAQDEAYSAKCVENAELRTECAALRAALTELVACEGLPIEGDPDSCRHCAALAAAKAALKLDGERL